MRGKTNLYSKEGRVLNVILSIVLVLLVIYLIFRVMNTGVFYGPTVPVANSASIFSLTNLTSSNLSGFCNVSDIDVDDENLTCYYVWYKNDVQFREGASNCTSNIETNINNINASDLIAGNWTLSCRALDNMGNFTAWINSSRLFIDMVPIINFRSTTLNGTLKQNYINISITAEDINLDQIVVELYNSTNLIYNSTSNTSISALVSNLPDGVYFLDVFANDTKGNENTTERIIILDNIAPNFTNLEYKIFRYRTPIQYQITASDERGIGCIKFANNNSDAYFNLTCQGLLTNNSVLLGTYWLNLSVNDSAGNVLYKTSVIVVTTDEDVTLPIISGVVVSANISDATITWQTNEPSSYSFKYGSNVSTMSSQLTSNVFGLSSSVRMDNLTNVTVYYYNITFCDLAGNCDTYSANFTTAAQAGTSPGDDSYVPSIYSVTYVSLTAGADKNNLRENDIVKVTFSTAGDQKNITILDISTSRVDLRANGTSYRFSINDSKDIDLDGDNIKDISIKLKSISNGSISLRFLKYAPASQGNNYTYLPPTGNNLDLQVETPDSTGTNYTPYIIWAIVLIVVLVIIILLVVKKQALAEFIQGFGSNQKPSEGYLKAIDLMRRAEFFIQQGRKDAASQCYKLIRQVFPMLRSNEKEIIRPRILRLFNLINQKG